MVTTAARFLPVCLPAWSVLVCLPHLAVRHCSSLQVLHKSATLRHALKSQAAGVDIIEVVGYEASIAGGQPGDEVGSWVMLAKAVAILDVPVVASGASATGRQLAAALAMGAHGVTMATRFLATVEAPIRQEIKDHMAREDVDERSTLVVLSRLNNATRVFRNDVTEEMHELATTAETLDFNEFRPLADGKRTRKMWQDTGDWNDAMWSCGQAVGLIDDVPTCAVLVDRMVKEAEERLAVGASRIVSDSNPPSSKL